jgi:hypothetical protein
MTPTKFPTVAAWPLPMQALRKPVPAEPPRQEPAPHPDAPDTETAAEAIAPLVSAAIARRARQRRYTG